MKSFLDALWRQQGPILRRAAKPSITGSQGEESSGVIARIKILLQLLRHFGPAWVLFRIGYAVRRKVGWLRAILPARGWNDQPLPGLLKCGTSSSLAGYYRYRREHAPTFFFDPKSRESLFKTLNQEGEHDDGDLVRTANDAVQGIFKYFGNLAMETGFPPDWHRDYVHGGRLTADKHWSQIDDFAGSDIKLVWEPNRFGFAFLLVRAYWSTGDQRYAEAFWKLVESWRENNPPQQGVNWKCGQEVGLRVMAWCFGLYGLLNCSASTPKRVADLAQMIAVSARRIEANIRYAVSQNNNHGITEAAALWTVGLLFPEFRRSGRWRRLGRRLLEQQGKELIYRDGACSQHSVNYLRVMLHAYIWSMRLGEVHDLPFSGELYERIAAAADFLYRIQEPGSGQTPVYGQNDGALIFPVNDCDYGDYRPVVQAARFLAKRRRTYGSGPWDEDLVWLFGADALDAPIDPPTGLNLFTGESGHLIMRTERGAVFSRAPTFRHRPGQADALHVDLWWRGQNIAVDPGTFSYNSPAPWNHAFARTCYHNTVTVNRCDQMQRVSRFMWLPWLRSEMCCQAHSQGRVMSYWEARHKMYCQKTEHRRGILRIGEEHWIVIDRLLGRSVREFRLHWLLADFPFQWLSREHRVQLNTDCGSYGLSLACSSADAAVSALRADPTSPRGWRSRYYCQREPAISVCMTADADAVDFLSVFGPDSCQLSITGHQMQVISDEWTACLTTKRHWTEVDTMLTSAVLSGSRNDQLAAA